jgi:hypothetical protein
MRTRETKKRGNLRWYLMIEEVERRCRAGDKDALEPADRYMTEGHTLEPLRWWFHHLMDRHSGYAMRLNISRKPGRPTALDRLANHQAIVERFEELANQPMTFELCKDLAKRLGAPPPTIEKQRVKRAELYVKTINHYTLSAIGLRVRRDQKLSNTARYKILAREFGLKPRTIKQIINNKRRSVG